MHPIRPQGRRSAELRLSSLGPVLAGIAEGLYWVKGGPQPQDQEHPMSEKPISPLRSRMIEDMTVRLIG